MTVGELRSRMTRREFCEWIAFFNWRADEVKRVREGLPESNPEPQTFEQIHQTMQRFANGWKQARGNGE